MRTTADEQQQAQSIIRQVVSQHLQDMLARGEELPADPAFETRLRAAIFSAIYGAGELQELLDDELVENIDINGCERDLGDLRRRDQKQLWRPVAATNEDLISIVQNLGSYAGMNARPFSPNTPTLDVRLQDGSRLSALMSATRGPVVSIRRNRYPQMFLRPDIAQAATKQGASSCPTSCQLGTVDRAGGGLPARGGPRRAATSWSAGHRRRKDDPAPRVDQLHRADRAAAHDREGAGAGHRRHPELHCRRRARWRRCCPTLKAGAGLDIADTGAAVPAAEPDPRHRRRGPGPRGG